MAFETNDLKPTGPGTLQIRAPFDGQVTNRKLGRLRGVFFKAGQDVLHFGRAGERELKVAVSERDEPHFRGAVGESLNVRIVGRAAVLNGQLTRVEARATQAPVHPALTALAGGPLAVRRSEDTVRRAIPTGGLRTCPTLLHRHRPSRRGRATRRRRNGACPLPPRAHRHTVE